MASRKPTKAVLAEREASKLRREWSEEACLAILRRLEHERDEWRALAQQLQVELIALRAEQRNNGVLQGR